VINDDVKECFHGLVDPTAGDDALSHAGCTGHDSAESLDRTASSESASAELQPTARRKVLETATTRGACIGDLHGDLSEGRSRNAHTSLSARRKCGPGCETQTRCSARINRSDHR
jgi:hypothetical protein